MQSQHAFIIRKSGFSLIQPLNLSSIPSHSQQSISTSDRFRQNRAVVPLNFENRNTIEFSSSASKNSQPNESKKDFQKQLSPLIELNYEGGGRKASLNSFSQAAQEQDKSQNYLNSPNPKSSQSHFQRESIRPTNNIEGKGQRYIQLLSQPHFNIQKPTAGAAAAQNTKEQESHFFKALQSRVQLKPIQSTPSKNITQAPDQQQIHVQSSYPFVKDLQIKPLPSTLTKQIIELPKGQFLDEKGHLKEFQINYAIKTRAGQYSPNVRKENQDSWISIPQFLNEKQASFFGICDGHGEYGHLVSNFIKKNLPKQFLKQIKFQGGWQKNDLNLQQILTKSFSAVSNELLTSKIDTFMSGTTAVTVLIRNNVLWCSNCGDSRAILGRDTGKASKPEWKSIQLSEDHKPDLQREKKRILEHGGRVEKQRDENGVAGGVFRVWNQMMISPGLAMSRSLGDKSAREVGVISDPEIFEIMLKEEDKFIVIASDGVWEFLSNAEVIKIVIPFYRDNDPDGASEAIIKNSVSAWQKHDENIIDDISCVVLFFQPNEEPRKRIFEYS